MNKVKKRSLEESNIKIKIASRYLYKQTKFIKLFVYFIAIIPIAMARIPGLKDIPNFSFIATLVSFSITILADLFGQFISNGKELAILLRQFYETEITGSNFAKIEYDRETTNLLNELAIRKGLASIGQKKYIEKGKDIPQEISDDYTYLYLVRLDAAKTNYLLSRVFYIYLFILGGIIAAFLGIGLFEQDTTVYLQLIIGFYPLISPIIKNLTGSKKTISNCIKISADIDNFFADGDTSLERLARFYYYVQNLEFEMLLNKPVVYNIVDRIFSRGQKILEKGVTIRFMDAIKELHTRKLLKDLALDQPNGKQLITRKEYTIEELEKKKQRRKTSTVNKVEETKPRETNKVASTTKTTTKKAPTKKETPKKTTTKSPKTK